MPNFLSEQQRLIQEISKRLATFKEHEPPEALARADTLGPVNFLEAIPIFERSFRLFRRLHEADLRDVPDYILQEVNQRLDRFLDRIDGVKKFDPRSGQSLRERDSFIQNWAEEFRQDYDAISRALIAAPPKAPDFSELRKEMSGRLEVLSGAQGILDKLQKMPGELEKKARETVDEIHVQSDKALEAARAAAFGTGIARHATAFREEAVLNAARSREWLLATAASALATGGFGWYLAEHYGSESQKITTSQLVQMTVARLFIFSVLYFATLWCARNFKAHKHNEITARHRQRALQTFEAFYAAGTDAATKNAVLIQSTTAIFAGANTGFGGNDGDGPPQPQIIEWIKTVGGKGEGG